ncbi:MAG: putative monovalent cation/H+ antiporter subunit A [Ectothiorhodospiraceae bacterium]|jgi:multicomponent Na+:H+ antiporter subunit A|nr:putative monovalent cation/H+ antiporter subunit A [Ectothiorhodospiraceae bacterium]
MLYAVLSGFLLAAVAPWLVPRLGAHAGRVLALLPAGLFLWFASLLPAVGGGETLLWEYAWVPGLDVQLGFLVDGLSLLFALLISGIGALVTLYAGSYLAGHRDLARFFVWLLAFMASMLGLVLSDGLIALFVFWELTSITSFMLIGFAHEDKAARQAALQGLFITVGGGLALLAGFVLLALAAGGWSLSAVLDAGDAVREHAHYAVIAWLIFLGAFTKSAQVPFHFWLPNAMAAPTPVSAYLHSATMVKAGVYLLARFQPALGGTDLWVFTLTLVGAATLFTGALLALRSSGMKRMLAYSTVMALGTLTLLAGIGGETAAIAFVAFLLAHSLYKGALFLIAGVIDHETGCREVPEMGGFGRAMPVSFAVAVLAALSAAGVMPLFGFIAKELLFESALGLAAWQPVVLTLTLAGLVGGVAVAAVVGLRPWIGRPVTTPREPHEAPLDLLAGPALLALLGLLFGLLPGLAERGLLAAAAGAVHGQAVTPNLALWHGLNLPLAMSALTLVAGLLVAWRWDGIRKMLAGLGFVERFGAERGYDAGMLGLVRVAAWQTRLLQNGHLRYYILTTLSATALLLVYALVTRHAVIPPWSSSGVRLYEVVIGAVVLMAALVAVTTRSRLGAVASLGAAGFGVALIYVLFSAPDVGITQVLIETLTVLMLVLVLFRLPSFLGLTPGRIKLRDASISLTIGGLMSWLLLDAVAAHHQGSISRYFVENAVPAGHGQNIVNVILVDFRALDTLGEIVVLGLAAIGVYAMIKLRAEDRRRRGKEEPR